MKKVLPLFFLINLCISLPDISYSQSCNAINGNAYYVTSPYDYGPGSLSQMIMNANADNVGGYIYSYIDTMYLNSPPPTITVDSLSLFVFSSCHIDCQFSVSDPVFTFAASASHSCVSPGVIAYNTAATTFTVTNTDDAGPGSLREAIAFSEVSPSQDQISFNIPGISPHTISPLSMYTVTRPLIIDGSTQPANGYTGIAPKISLDGNHIVGTCFYFDYLNNYNAYGWKLYGCHIHGFESGISCYFAHSITIGATNKRNVFNDDTAAVTLSECRNITIENNFFGTDTSGIAAGGNNYYALQLIDDSNVVIKNNLVSGNVWGIDNNGCTTLSIKGNKIGTDVTGTYAIANEHGMYLQFGLNLTVGGTGVGEGNIISGNLSGSVGEGIYSHFNTNITIAGNKIGTDITGTLAIPNYFGIRIDDDGAMIGGTTASARNIISGNTYGIEVEGSGPTIQGNFIGTDVTGSAAIGNSTAVEFYSGNSDAITTINNNLISGNSIGIRTYNSIAYYHIYRNKIGVDFSGQNALPNITGIGLTNEAGGGMVGGIDASFANIISGNTSDGITINNDQQFQDSIMNNKIGVDSALTTLIPNATGIDLAVNADQNYIVNNVIAGNTTSGISISYNSSLNLISQNSIYQNGADGINCYGEQNTFTHNAIGDNSGKGINNNGTANGGIATPVVLVATANNVSGTALPNATIELFYNQSINANPQGFTWIGNVSADNYGNWNYTGAISAPCLVTTTQTDGLGNTSEFSSLSVQSIDLGPDSTICEGTTFTIDAGPGFDSYSWNTGDTTASVTVDTTGYYSVSVTNISGCSATDTVYVLFVPCLSINEHNGVSISLYPNPACDVVYISSSINFNQSSIEWFDAKGRKIYVPLVARISPGEIIQQEIIAVDVSGLPGGIYYCRIISPEGVHWTSTEEASVKVVIEK
ncbi:MAG TPA: right-handed parallel beta-helix repeat-containing protein [Chitinophagales bacterium]|nr:right-handed parallel beta-helix repeat-containing protein [Chitinophagales bacterium]